MAKKKHKIICVSEKNQNIRSNLKRAAKSFVLVCIAINSTKLDKKEKDSKHAQQRNGFLSWQ